MITKIQKTYHYLFPVRQLLIRQNGEVKYIRFSALIQFSFVLALVISFALLTYSGFEYFILNDKISLTKNKLNLSQHSLKKLSLTYQEKHNALALKLEQVEQQQQLLQNILDSMPSAMTSNTTQHDKANLKATNAQSKTQTKKSALQFNLTDPSKNTDIALSNMENMAVKLQNLTNSQADSRVKLEKKIEQRMLLLQQSILLAGLSPDHIFDHFTTQVQSQGGPLDYLSIASMSADNQSLLNKLVELLELENSLNSLPLSFPAKKYYISSRFGIRKDPMVKRLAMHKGIDMAGWIKTEIYAPASGIVRRAGPYGSYGRFIEIDHQNGFMTRYAHLNKIKVKKGQQISKNEIIGLMGSTGRSTSTHLHYEILFDNKQINPLKLIKALTDVL
ncbi:MAG: M23 family metallopeptidase [Colwellia sp.]